jgi:hypothetical protein
MNGKAKGHQSAEMSYCSWMICDKWDVSKPTMAELTLIWLCMIK